MKMTDGHTLLSLYAKTGSDSAFRELVSRYLDFVYSTAFRLVGGDAETAQDVTQTVFVALAEKARTLPKDVMLGGWLHQHTRFVARELMRTERRRQLRERQAAEMNAIEDHTESNLAQVAPVLDEAIGQLDEEDRAAILLRFFERKDFRSVGEALGSSEDAARKRVDRALEKLHVLLKHRGATLSVAALGTALATEAVTAAPAGLATSISSAVLLAGSTTAATVAATKAIAMTTFQKAIAIATVTVLAGVGIYEARQAAQLRGQVEILQQQQAPLAGQVEQLTRERDGLTSKLAVMRDDNGRLNANAAELPKLRGMIDTLRRELESQKTAAATASSNLTEASMATHKPGSFISKDQLADLGFKTPEAGFQTYFHALLSGNYDHVLTAMLAQPGAPDPKEREAYEKSVREDDEVSRLQGIQMLAKKVIADDRVDVEFLIYLRGKSPVIHIQQMVKEGGEWKAGNSQGVEPSWSQDGQIQPLTP
jgi:RNA polymerase sigma factor (sigma-70 family)